MYRVNKEYGTSENVYLQNTDTMAELNLGRITPGLLTVLEEDGYKFEDLDHTDEAISLKEKWALKVSNKVKDELRTLAMPMKKPIRDQRKKKEETIDRDDDIDLFDLIYNT